MNADSEQVDAGKTRKSLSKWVRQIHRWLSIIFTVAVIANLIVMGREQYPIWLGVLTLLPLAFLLLTGLYLFVLPYAVKWRSIRRPRGEGEYND